MVFQCFASESQLGMDLSSTELFELQTTPYRPPDSWDQCLSRSQDRRYSWKACWSWHDEWTSVTRFYSRVEIHLCKLPQGHQKRMFPRRGQSNPFSNTFETFYNLVREGEPLRRPHPRPNPRVSMHQSVQP